MTTRSDRIAVSSWSLDRTLGAPRNGRQTLPGLPLLELPAALHAHGYTAVQLCHFHLPSTTPDYLQQLRRALHDADVHLDALLIDDGDLTDPEEGSRWLSWTRGWVDVAEQLHATRARVIAGKTRTATAHSDSSSALRQLATAAHTTRIVTENWFDLTATADDVDRILSPVHPEVGLLVDLGNWDMPDKYAQLARIASYGETCHAKAHWDGGTMRENDYRASIYALESSGYTGPYALVYDADDPNEWAGLEQLRDVIESELRTDATQ